MFNRSVTFFVLLAATAANIPLAYSLEAPPANPKTQNLGPLAFKLDSRLIPAVNALHAGAITDAVAARDIKGAQGRAIGTAADPNLLPIRIDAAIDDALLAQIAATGAQVIHAAPQWDTISANATLSQIDALSQIAAVRAITLQSGRRRRQQGGTSNAADTEMNAALIRAKYGVTGKGQTVGVLSDSVIDTRSVKGTGSRVTGTAPNAFVTGTVPQNTGDLPPKFQLVDPGPGAGSDEGEAIMELIYDVAPGAGLAFASANIDQAIAASNLIALRTAANCTVTTDDVAFLDEPVFQDGPMAQAISANARAGVAHFSAFGNEGDHGVLAAFTPIDTSLSEDDMADPPTGKSFHNWGIATATPQFLPIALSAGNSVTIVMEWNQPYASFKLGAGSQADLDMYLYSSPKIGTPLAAAASPQGTAGAPKNDPLEILNYTNTGKATTVYLAVDHFQGVRNNVIWLVFNDTNLDISFPSGGVNGPTGSGHASSVDAIGVAAIDSADILAGNLKPESFSSKGGIGENGIPYYFDTAGNLLPNAPRRRSAPDISAPDNVDTSKIKGFKGTSCAAPNAASVAALLKEAAPDATTAILVSTLKTSARDAAAPPASPGPDAFTGAGLVDADSAFRSLILPPVITSPATASGNVASFFNYVITASGPGNLSYSANNLPPGLTSNGNIISGVPTAQGTFGNVSVTATNLAGTTTQMVTFTIGAQIPVRITAAPAVSPNPASAGTALSFTATAASDTGLPLSYAWNFGDGATGTGNPAVHTYGSAGNFNATVSVSDGTASVSSNVLAMVTQPLAFISTPAALPPESGVGQTVFFVASAFEDSTVLTYTWIFGDGTTGSGATPTHAYNVPGTFAATVTVSDGNGHSITSSITVTVKAPVVGLGIDSDGDGFSDSFETAIGTNPNDPGSSPVGGVADTPLPLTVLKPSIKLNFARVGSDMVTFSGTLPLRAGVEVNGILTAVDVSGISAAFMLNAKGVSTPPSPASFRLRFKSLKGVVAAQTASFAVKLSRGSFADILAASGLASTAVSNKPVTLVFSVVFDGKIYQSTRQLSYSSKGGTTGTAK